jgi:hypothetical protein
MNVVTVAEDLEPLGSSPLDPQPPRRRALRRRTAVPRLALRWPDEVAAALGVSRSWLYASGLASELRFVRTGKVRLVLVGELERVLERQSSRWDQ